MSNKTYNSFSRFEISLNDGNSSILRYLKSKDLDVLKEDIELIDTPRKLKLNSQNDNTRQS